MPREEDTYARVARGFQDAPNVRHHGLRLVYLARDADLHVVDKECHLLPAADLRERGPHIYSEERLHNSTTGLPFPAARCRPCGRRARLRRCASRIQTRAVAGHLPE